MIGRRAVWVAALTLLCLQAALLLQLPLIQGHSWFTTAVGTPTPSDFLAYRVAGSFALEGRAAAAYDWQAFSARLAAITEEHRDHWLGWLNPPNYLLVIAPLALLPYGTAAFVWLD